VPFVAAAVLVFAFGASLADKMALKVTTNNGGAREAERHLPDLILPFSSGIAGRFVSGIVAENNLHWVNSGGWFVSHHICLPDDQDGAQRLHP